MFSVQELEQQRAYLEQDRKTLEKRISQMDGEVKQLIANLHGFEGALQFCDGLIRKAKEREIHQAREAGRKFAVAPQQIGAALKRPEVREKLKQIKPKPLEQLKKEITHENNQSAPA